MRSEAATLEAISMLIVDDDDVLRERLAQALRSRGFEVRCAGDYEAAIALIKQDPPERMVVDLRMPGRSGLELLRDAKALEPQTRIVVLTGYGSIATAIDAMRLGATHYLPKPADADDVVAAFERGEAPPLQEHGGGEFTLPSAERVKWEHINRVLSDCAGNVSEAARRLGLHRRTLQRILQKHPPRQ